MPLDVLLKKMQGSASTWRLIIDEYGGTDGLCTIEDLLETLWARSTTSTTSTSPR
jgi:magnesium and cobalt transporter